MSIAEAPEEFYATFTERNVGFIDPRVQEGLGGITVLIAGCGSTGGAAVEPLARLGVRSFILADTGRFELNNLNRQHADYADIGAHKAEVADRRIHRINPLARTLVHPEGITEDNAVPLVGRADLVVDGVDVTERSGWRAKYLLHEAAQAAGTPVITGYDMAGTQYVRFYDYRRRMKPFDGRITGSMVRDKPIWELLFRAIPARHIPVETIRNALEHVDDPEYSVPQLVYASLLFGALTARMAAALLAEEDIREHVVLDAHHATRTGSHRLRARAAHPLALVAAVRKLAALRRAGGKKG